MFFKGTHGQVREVSDRVLPQCPLGILIPGGGIGGGPQDAVWLEEFLGIFWNYLGLPWGSWEVPLEPLQMLMFAHIIFFSECD